jgi:hypothetical protein
MEHVDIGVGLELLRAKTNKIVQIRKLTHWDFAVSIPAASATRRARFQISSNMQQKASEPL